MEMCAWEAPSEGLSATLTKVSFAHVHLSELFYEHWLDYLMDFFNICIF